MKTWQGSNPLMIMLGLLLSLAVALFGILVWQESQIPNAPPRALLSRTVPVSSVDEPIQPIPLSLDLNPEKVALSKQLFNVKIFNGLYPVGIKKFIDDLWGDTVNIASCRESHRIPRTIQVTAEIYHPLQDKYHFEERGLMESKGKGPIKTYLLIDRLPLVL